MGAAVQHATGATVALVRCDDPMAADRGIGIVPEVARHRSIHPAVRFVPLVGAPPSPVSLAFLPHVQEPLLRAFVDSATGHR